MAEMPAGLFDRAWSRAPLILRLTTAGLPASIALALVFGLGIAAIQRSEAQRGEEQRSLREARAVARALDVTFFGEGRKAGDPVSADARPQWQLQLDSLRGLLDLEGLAAIRDDGSVYVASTRGSNKGWGTTVTTDSASFKKVRGGELRDVQQTNVEGVHMLEAVVANSEASLHDDGTLSATEEQAVRLAQASPFKYVAVLRNLRPVEERVATLGVLSVVEALVTAALLLLGGLLFVRREVANAVVQVSSIVAELARTGELGAARAQLLKVWGRVTQDEGDRNELRQLVCGIDALLASLERLAAQANAIARDDLWNEAFDKEGETRGDLAVAFRKMVSNLRELSIRVGRIARGDLSVGASAPGTKEGSLGSAFREMTEKLKLLLDELASAGSKIDRSARGLQESSRDQASTATQQAAAVTETMATMEELAASSGHIADTAKHVVQLADETLLSAKNGNTAVTDVGTGMDEIVAASRQGAHRLLDLGEKSRSIGKVAELITGIAEQSKILALNAAIEAARAGEAGRGFGVVAEEVRNLADHVVESTREIEGLIGQIQSEISAAVLASEEEVKRAEKGRELATRATSSLQAITDTASRTTDAARQIELATNQQRSASGQVATAVREVASSSEEVATGAKRVTVSANELAALAHDLQAVINQFEVSEDGSGKRAHGATSASRPVIKTPGAPQQALAGSGERASLDSEALRRG